MFTKARRQLTYANVVSSICLFMLLGGTAYAATRIGTGQIVNNSVRSQDLRNGNVTSRDIKDNGVHSKDVRNGSLLASDFQPGQLRAGPRGPQGPTGAPGQAATKLFAAIRDPGIDSAAVVEYGTGVSGVVDVAHTPAYLLTFDRSVANCVVHATAGATDPDPTRAQYHYAIPAVDMYIGSANQVQISFANAGGSSVDTSFLVTAFC